jgi:hypothetical protein
VPAVGGGLRHAVGGGEGKLMYCGVILSFDISMEEDDDGACYRFSIISWSGEKSVSTPV